MKENFRCSEFGNPNSSDACLQCPSNLECCKEQQKMSGLKQKSKTCLEIVQTLEKTADVNWREDKTKWVRLADAEDEIDEIINADLEEHKRVLKEKDEEIGKLEEKYKHDMGLKESEIGNWIKGYNLLQKRLGQIRELLNKRRWMPTNPDEAILPLGWHEWVISTNQILEELVGLLGQNLEKPEPKKEEKAE